MKGLPTLDRLTPAPQNCPACGAGRNLLESGDCRLLYLCGGVYELNERDPEPGEPVRQEWTGACPVEQPGDAQPTDADLERIAVERGADLLLGPDERVRTGTDERIAAIKAANPVYDRPEGNDDDRADFTDCWNALATAATILKRIMERRSMEATMLKG